MKLNNTVINRGGLALIVSLLAVELAVALALTVPLQHRHLPTETGSWRQPSLTRSCEAIRMTSGEVPIDSVMRFRVIGWNNGLIGVS